MTSSLAESPPFGWAEPICLMNGTYRQTHCDDLAVDPR